MLSTKSRSVNKSRLVNKSRSVNKSSTNVSRNKSKKICPDKIEFSEKKLIYKYFHVKSIYKKDDQELLMITDGEINYLLIISNSNLEKTLYFTCFNKNKILLEFQDYGISITENPFDENSKKGKYYFIILKSYDMKSTNVKSINVKLNNVITLETAITLSKIDLYRFKQLFKQLLVNYAKLNTRTDFKYNNFNMNSILLNNGVFVLYDFTNSIDDTKYKTFGKRQDPKTLFFNNNKDYSNRDKEIMTIHQSNYDIICILLLINLCERRLNEKPVEISLNKEDKALFNSTDELFEKIKYITNMDYFKTL